MLPNERRDSAIAFTARALGWFKRFGITGERIMTDNGSADKSHACRNLRAGFGIKHKRTKPYTPRTNGKAERFIQTSLREWAYANAYETSTAVPRRSRLGSPNITPPVATAAYATSPRLLG